MATQKEKLIASAQKLVEKGQYDKAVKDYLKVVGEDPSDVRVWLKIGDLYAKLNRVKEATETYERVATHYSDAGHFLKAVAVYKQILRIDPRSIEVNLRLAEMYKQLGLTSDAMQQFEAVAAFFHRENRPKEALEALRQIAELDPQNVAARIKLAEVYSKEGMTREAVSEFARAAEFLHGEQRFDDYLKVAERLLFHQPDNRPVSREVARLYIGKGDPRRALPKLQVCLKADARDVEALALLGAVFEGLDQRDKVVSVLKELARVHDENGDTAQRNEAYQRVLQIDPRDADARAGMSRPPNPTPRAPALTPATGTPMRDPGATPAPAATVNPGSGARKEVTLEAPGESGVPLDSSPKPAPLGRIAVTKAVVRVTPEPMQVAVRQRADTARDEGSGARIDSPPSQPAISREVEEQVAKILSETDVYSKYGLHGKALDHVHKAVVLAPSSIDARDKLKSVYVALGRIDEAAVELRKLAELTGGTPRAEKYLRELLELKPNDQAAIDLMARAVASVRGGAREAPPADARHTIVEAPPPSRDRAGVSTPGLDGDEVEVPADAADGIEEISGMVVLDESVLDETGPEEDPYADAIDAAIAADTGAGEDEVPVVVDDGAADSIDELGYPPDSDAGGQPGEAAGGEATLGDGEMRFGAPDALTPVPGEEPMRVLRAAVDQGASTEFGEPLADGEAMAGALPAGLPDELDEADFFLQQSLLVDARTLLEGIHARYGDLPQILTKLADLEAREHDAAVAAGIEIVTEDGAAVDVAIESSGDISIDVPVDVVEETSDGMEVAHEPPPARGAPKPDSGLIDLGAAIESELPPEPPGATRSASQDDGGLENGTERGPDRGTDRGSNPYQSARSETTGQRRAVLEKGVNPEDFETHYDLGIAYKEMGLVDDAIGEFNLVMQDPAREVECHMMIGLCFRQKGQMTDAINHFKEGLYSESIHEREKLALYYELGQAYEGLSDSREALYYYEKVFKRDPAFRDVEQRIVALREDGIST